MTARKVLIVEDNPALLRGLKDNFQAQGYQVRTASDGAKGMEDFFRDPPDLVLLDLMLPKVNGYEICRQARSRQLATPILMLSAKCLEDDVVRGFELGADDYMTKPFGIRELMARARRLSRGNAPPPPQGPQATVRSPQSAAHSPQSTDCGPPAANSAPRTAHWGPWTVDRGLQTVDRGLRTADGGAASPTQAQS
jgi:DNA-binding response OmpR family regulator